MLICKHINNIAGLFHLQHFLSWHFLNFRHRNTNRVSVTVVAMFNTDSVEGCKAPNGANRDCITRVSQTSKPQMLSYRHVLLWSRKQKDGARNQWVRHLKLECGLSRKSSGPNLLTDLHINSSHVQRCEPYSLDVVQNEVCR
jgi:hypothetical protein